MRTFLPLVLLFIYSQARAADLDSVFTSFKDHYCSRLYMDYSECKNTSSSKDLTELIEKNQTRCLAKADGNPQTVYVCVRNREDNRKFMQAYFDGAEAFRCGTSSEEKTQHIQ